MPTDASFIQAIIAAPNDATLRLVYADWLDDRDDLRGEYLRLQHALCLHSGNPCHAKDIQIQLTTLAAQLPLPWLAFFDGSAAWERLRQLGPKVRDKGLFSEALAAARATMECVRHNVAILAERLPTAGYCFADPAGAYLPPSGQESTLIAEIEEAIGPMPMSFRAFYEVVGSVNFCQSLEQLVQWHDERRSQATEVELLGEEDPLYVLPLPLLHQDLLTARSSHDKLGRYARYGWRPGGEERWYCHFACDEFHKANYSGGENYNLFIPDPCADFRIRDLFLGAYANEEEDREWFIDYLRTVFRGAGFRGKSQDSGEKRPPLSSLIQRLRVGLLEV